MLDRDTITSALYTRQQVARVTGLDDSTLNYWMREGVLRASEGGVGKGQHRRFPYHQINLAILLNELRGFGVSLPEMKRLAMRFHEALDYFEREGISQENEEPLSTIVYRRQEFETKGFVSESVPEGKLPRYRELFPWFEGRSLHRKYDHLDWNFEANLDEAIDIIRRAYLAYDRVPDKTEMYPDSIVDLAKRIDIGEYYSARRYWATIAYLEQMVSHDPEYYSANYLYRNADREWEVTRGDPDPSLTSYVGIKLDLLTLKAWSKA